MNASSAARSSLELPILQALGTCINFWLTLKSLHEPRSKLPIYVCVYIYYICACVQSNMACTRSLYSLHLAHERNLDHGLDEQLEDFTQRLQCSSLLVMTSFRLRDYQILPEKEPERYIPTIFLLHYYRGSLSNFGAYSVTVRRGAAVNPGETLVTLVPLRVQASSFLGCSNPVFRRAARVGFESYVIMLICLA